LNQYQIDNLTKYLDTGDDGFIAVDRFDVELRNAHAPAAGGASMGNTLNQSASGNTLHNQTMGSSMAGKRRQKWA